MPARARRVAMHGGPPGAVCVGDRGSAAAWAVRRPQLPVRVLLLSRYGRLGASSRVRSYQYLPYLQEEGVDVTTAPLLGDGYIERLYGGRRQNAASIMAAYWTRLWRLITCARFDLLWVEYELFPW